MKASDHPAKEGRMNKPLKPMMGAGELNGLLAKVFPQLNRDRQDYVVTEVFPGGCTIRLNAGYEHLRPGDTVSGVALFALADLGGYACVLSHAGPDALSVTTNISINFMRKAGPGPVDGRCRILKLGRSLMVYDIEMTAGPDGEIVAHATGTYSIPPKSIAVK
ncbi:MAG: thioesterase [Rhizobiales bacterium 65-79]|jgi:uncharacterized protein (TIGR00369 family)|nr:MAG: thioesterase [Rhizobiales bacterium 65-79]